MTPSPFTPSEARACRARSRGALGVLLFALTAGCATVKMSRLRPDYDTTDRKRVKRLVVVTAEANEGGQRVSELWSLMTRKYVNGKRSFMVKQNAVASAGSDPRALCGDGLEGVLVLKPTVKKAGSGVEAGVFATLSRCADGQEIWACEAGGSWDSDDPNVREAAAQYASELGEEIRPYVAPSFHLLKAALDTLPDPILEEAEIDEKIEMGE